MVFDVDAVCISMCILKRTEYVQREIIVQQIYAMERIMVCPAISLNHAKIYFLKWEYNENIFFLYNPEWWFFSSLEEAVFQARMWSIF